MMKFTGDLETISNFQNEYERILTVDFNVYDCAKFRLSTYLSSILTGFLSSENMAVILITPTVRRFQFIRALLALLRKDVEAFIYKCRKEPRSET